MDAAYCSEVNTEGQQPSQRQVDFLIAISHIYKDQWGLIYVFDALGCSCLLDNSHIYISNSAISLLDEDSTQNHTERHSLLSLLYDHPLSTYRSENSKRG